MGQQNGGYQHGANDGLRAVQDEIAGGANEGQQCGNNTLDWKLKQLDRADGGRAYTQRNQFGADRDAPVAEKRVNLAACSKEDYGEAGGTLSRSQAASFSKVKSLVS